MYVAVPDPAGNFGPTLSAGQLLAALPPATAHEYQHLVNASRHLYAPGAAGFEQPWLDEGLSQVAEELLFLRQGSRRSHENLNAFDLSVTDATRNAFAVDQRENVDNYRHFLDILPHASPLDFADSAAARGAAWSLLRYLVDRRNGIDYVTWSQLVTTSSSGLTNLSDVFGADVRVQMRDWSVALLTDDLAATAIEFQQPSWNFRSLFASMGVTFPLVPQTLHDAAPVTTSLPSAGSGYYAFTVRAGHVARVSWTGSGGAAVSPLLQWSIVRLQ
jgi:hypothetical protein